MVRDIGMIIMVISLLSLYIASMWNEEEKCTDKDVKVAMFFLICLSVGLAMTLS